MVDRRFVCTAANPYGGDRKPGMLGSGYAPFPSDIGMRAFPRLARLGGFYEVDDPFRSSLATSCPAIHGPRRAIVVGRRGEEIYTDELVRVSD
ncbi:hypothetical protein [Pseudomonas japonica]|uniref:hypothetical protein n=1 Tax=Pseudomonas japonica TaxID=256466 RepID=UPI0015E41655|nr:hypothetical protein [Pseudomonas japonica]MBA1245050.1 hypothetical protein [Pseudomonas japonica]